MAVAMPPAQAVEYRIDKPSSLYPDSAMAGIHEAVAAARKSVSSMYHKAVDVEPSRVDRMFPTLNERSPALSRADRDALDGVQKTDFWGNSKAGEVSIPNSYIGERIKLGLETSRVMDKARSGGDLTSNEEHDLRCRQVSVAMDKRAGLYVQGGEKAAAAARQAIPRDLLEECRSTVIQAQQTQSRAASGHVQNVALTASQARSHRIEVSPAAHAQGITRVNLEVSKPSPVNVDPRARQTPPVRINPIARQMPVTHLDI